MDLSLAGKEAANSLPVKQSDISGKTRDLNFIFKLT
jgi:hypothetical protein